MRSKFAGKSNEDITKIYYMRERCNVMIQIVTVRIVLLFKHQETII